MLRRALFTIAIATSLLFTAACSDDSSDKSNDAGGKDSGTAGDKDAGKSDSGMMPVTMIECGTATCKVEGLLATFAEPCCASAADATCGLKRLQGGNGECNATVKPDARCESVDLMGVFQVPSCCTDDGRCGLDGSMFGMPGCVPLEEVASRASMVDAGMTMGGMSFDVPAPRACDESDSGVEDAGR